MASRPNLFTLALAAPLGALIAAALTVAIGSWLLSEGPSQPLPGPDDQAQFMAAWERALTADHVGTGTVTTPEGTVSIRRARLGGRELSQTGTAALITVESGNQATTTACEQSSTGAFACSDPTPALTRQQRLARIASTVEGDYEVQAEANNCWTARRRGEANGWGDATRFCFDPLTGTMISKKTWQGATVERTSVMVSAMATTASLAPVPIGETEPALKD